MTNHKNNENRVKRTATGGRIYEQADLGVGDIYDSSRYRYTKASEPMLKPTLKERFLSFITLGLR